MGKKITAQELQARFCEREAALIKERKIIQQAKERELKLRKKQYQDKNKIKKLFAESPITLEGFDSNDKIIIREIRYSSDVIDLWCTLSNEKFDGYLDIIIDKNVTFKDVADGKTKLVLGSDTGIVQYAKLQLVDIGELTLKEV